MMKAGATVRETGDGEGMESLAQRSFSWERRLFGVRPHVSMLRALMIVLFGSLAFQVTFLPLKVGGESMMPTFDSDEYLLAERLSYRWGTPRRGDVVAIQTPERGVTILKRVLAVPGDEVAMQGGAVRVNGTWLDEPYAAITGGWDLSSTHLGRNEYWVVGDNRMVSAFGKVQRQHILGKVW